ncbi:mannose-6-phosphatase [Russula earlei]|uniref:Mannose-6-phosphatase n=1 Tax=Russula earlei TaxID=71964 RepID=A0ACC0U1A4_9AGAM|nr:mannose-6-phosphatase [Russula earlei]
MSPFSISVRLATWNLRFDAQPDSIPVAASLAALPDPRAAPLQVLLGEQPWSDRRVRVAQRLWASHVDLVGFQEALIRQVRDLEELMDNEFAWVGVGRDDGIAAGEFNPIFYRRTAFTLLETDTFWLSHEPFKPGSRFPGAGSPRLATFALFRLSAPAGNPPRNVALINLHLDNVSDAQRRFGAAMVLHRARFEAYERPEVPLLVTGDFNSSTSGPDSGAYAVLTGTAPAPTIPDEFARRFPFPSRPNAAGLVMHDLRVVAPRPFVGGDWATFTDFWHRKDDQELIDFVFGRSDGGWKAKGAFIETALSDDGMLASDHRPVVTDVVIS